MEKVLTTTKIVSLDHKKGPHYPLEKFKIE